MVDRYINKKFEIDCFHTAFRFEYDSDFIFKGERHDFWEANFVRSGRITVTQDENVFTIGEGDIVFHSPLVFHRIQSAENTRPVGYTFSFHAVGQLPEELNCAFFKLDSQEISELKSIMELLIPYVDGGADEDFRGQMIRDMLSAFLLKLSLKASGTIDVNSESARVYQKLVVLMEKNARSNLTLTDFARLESISVSYIKLLFNMYAGVSPKSYYDSLRAAEAKRLLMDGLSVNEVSEMMSFSSPNYFSCFFKRYFGLPPHRYVNSLQNAKQIAK